MSEQLMNWSDAMSDMAGFKKNVEVEKVISTDIDDTRVYIQGKEYRIDRKSEKWDAGYCPFSIGKNEKHPYPLRGGSTQLDLAFKGEWEELQKDFRHTVNKLFVDKTNIKKIK